MRKLTPYQKQTFKLQDLSKEQIKDLLIKYKVVFGKKEGERGWRNKLAEALHYIWRLDIKAKYDKGKDGDSSVREEIDDLVHQNNRLKYFTSEGATYDDEWAIKAKTYVFYIEGNQRDLVKKQKKLIELINSLPYVYSAQITKKTEYPYFDAPDRLGIHFKNSYCLFQVINTSIGDAYTKSEENMCAPKLIADSVNIKGQVYTGSNQYSHPFDMDYILANLTEIRKNMPDELILPNGTIHRPDKHNAEPGFTIIEVWQFCIKERIQYFIVQSVENYQKIFEWYHPDYGNNNIRLRPGIAAIVAGNHFSNLNIRLQHGEKIKSQLPSKPRIKDWNKAINKHWTIHEYNIQQSTIQDYAEGKDLNYPVIDSDKLRYKHALGNTIGGEVYPLYHITQDGLIPYNNVKTTYYIEGNIEAIFSNYCQEGYMPTILQTSKDRIKTFSVRNVLYVECHDYYKCVKFANECKIQYNGQSMNTLIYMHFKNSVKSSYCSPATYTAMTGFIDSFPEFSDAAPFRYNWCAALKEVKKTIKYNAADIRKSYTHALTNMSFGSFAFHDDPEPFNNRIIEQGWYYVDRTDTTFPLLGRCFIPGVFAKELIQDNLITKQDITIQIVPTHRYKAGHLKQIIETIYKHAGKEGVNILNGMLKKTSYDRKDHSWITESSDDLFEAMGKYKDIEIKDYNIGDRELYRITAIDKKLPIYSNYLPIHFYTYNYAILHLYREIKKINGLPHLVAVNTDCAIFEPSFIPPVPGKSAENKDEIGLLTREFDKFKVPEKLHEPYDLPDDVEYTLDREFTTFNIDSDADKDIAIKNLANGQSYILERPGGYGKTYFAKRVIKYFREQKRRVIITAATANAAREIDDLGITIHSFLNLRRDKDDDDDKREKWNRFIDLVIIDEFWFLSNDIYDKILYKKLKHNTTLLILGCTRQLCIDKKLTRQNSFTYALSNGHYLDLTKNMRCECPILQTYLENEITWIDRKGPRPSLDVITNKNHETLSITTLNATAILINDYHASKHKQLYNEHVPFGIYTGMPVVAIQNHSQFKNSEHFAIAEIKADSIVLYHSTINREVNTEKTLEISAAVFGRYFLRAYSLTCHRVQSKTIRIPFTIYEIDKADLMALYDDNWRCWRYTAIGRAKYINQISIADYHDIVEEDDRTYGYIYRIINKTDGNCYIGSTFHFDIRMQQHKEQADFIRLYGGPDNFDYTIVEEMKKPIHEKELKKIELEYIDREQPFYNQIDPIADK